MMEANYLAHGCCPPPHEVNWNLRAKVVAGQRHFYERGTFRFRNASCPVPAQELLSVVLRSASPSSQRSNPHQRDSGSADDNCGCNPRVFHPSFLKLSPSAVTPPAFVRPAAASSAPLPKVSAAGTLSNPAVFPSGPQQTGGLNCSPLSFLMHSNATTFFVAASKAIQVHSSSSDIA